jgi:AcrR family transcriptional regulator
MVERVDGRRVRYQHRREALLQAAAEVAHEQGTAGLSLREVAKQIGVSHATLVHHFSTRDQLITEIVERVVTNALVPPEIDRTQGVEVWVRGLWAYWRSPDGQRFVKLFLTVVGHSLYDQVGSAALRGSIDHRRSRLTEALTVLGCPPAEAVALADYLTATLRGLLLELLVTGDGGRADAAFELLVCDLEARSARWSPAGSGPSLAAPAAGSP